MRERYGVRVTRLLKKTSRVARVCPCVCVCVCVYLCVKTFSSLLLPTECSAFAVIIGGVVMAKYADKIISDNMVCPTVVIAAFQSAFRMLSTNPSRRAPPHTHPSSGAVRHDDVSVHKNYVLLLFFFHSVERVGFFVFLFFFLSLPPSPPGDYFPPHR